MTLLRLLAAIPALILGLALASEPALAQTASADRNSDRAQRTVSGRDLMTPEERAGFRREMEQATPEQQQKLWERKHGELSQRAAQRGAVLAEPNPRSGGMAESRRNAAEGGRGESRGPMTSRMMGSAPRAP